MKAISIKTYLSYLPEILLGLFSLAGVITDIVKGTVGISTYAFLGLFTLIAALLISRKWYFAHILTCVLAFTGLILFMATLSEYNEFTSGQSGGRELLLGGCSLALFLFLSAFFLPWKYR